MMRYEESREANPDGAPLPPSLEPKMTRSRTRQLLADSQLSQQLPLTPVKDASSTEQLILQEFPEDDDDEEYTPQKDVDESALTASTCSSPTPSSPTPSSPTPSSPTPSSPCSSRSASSSRPQTPRTPGSVASEPDEPLSSRTRSRLPLNDLALEELERLVSALGRRRADRKGRRWLGTGELGTMRSSMQLCSFFFSHMFVICKCS